MTATIMLAKGYSPVRLQFPVMASEKLDGVPAKIHITINEGVYPPSSLVSTRVVWTVQTRQAKPFVSIHSQVEALAEHLKDMNCKGTFVFIAEVTHKDKTMPFKTISGHCRRHEQNDDLRLNVFDFYRPTPEQPDTRPFGKRIMLVQPLVLGMFWCKMVPQILCRDAVELAHAIASLKSTDPEGVVIRNCNDKWVEGKRGWGYQKLVERPTIELCVRNYECAVDKDGEFMGMVGRINCYYKDMIIGVGPGKMTHTERTEEWQKNLGWDAPFADCKRWCTVSYKRDPSYNKLREPTFQHWRPDYEPE